MKKENIYVILKELYPIVVKSIEKNKFKYKQCLERFITKRYKELYDIAPCDRIYYGDDDIKDLFSSLDIDIKEITTILDKTYYAPMKNFNPRAAKDEVTVLMLCIVKYFNDKKMVKELELSMIYLSFSGKFYPSIHYSSYPKVQPSEYRHIMEYVVNNMLTNKFDLQTQGSVVGAIKSISLTWITTYKSLFVTFNDENVVYLIQQLHNRIKSFTKNIAELYYSAYEDKEYITYDSDSLDSDSYRLADSNSLKAMRIIERTIETLNSSSVDYQLCKLSADQNIKIEEIKSIIESIISSKNSMPEVSELLNLLVNTYYSSSKSKDITSVEFIAYAVSPKPNNKDKNIIRLKEIVENWLDENSTAYKRRKSRLATKNSYNKAVLSYFALLVNKSNK